MRLLAVADLHGREERMRAVTRMMAEEAPDAVVVAGDLAPGRRLVAALEALDALGRPVYLVRGNCEGGGFDAAVARYPNLTRLTAVPITRGGIHLLGLGGTLPLPFASRIIWNEAALLATLPPPAGSTILVVHPPPHGLLDGVLGCFHAGSRGIARWIERHRPKLVLCGHIHEQAGVAAMESTTVVNCAVGRYGGGALIEMDADRPKVRMLPPVA